MSYYDPVLAQRIRRALEDLGVNTDNYPDLIRVYYLIRLLSQHLPQEREIMSNMFEETLCSTEVLADLASVDVQPFPSSRIAALRTMLDLVQKNGLDNDHIRFFRLLAPALVADWAGFSKMFPDDDWKEMMLVLYQISVRIFRASGTSRVFDYNPGVITSDILKSGHLGYYPMEFLDSCVRHVLYIELTSIKQLKKGYVRKLNDVLKNIVAICDDCGNINAHDCTLHYLATGEVTADENLNFYLRKLRNVLVSDVVSVLQPEMQKDDILTLQFVLMRFFEIAQGEMLIYNPGPTMLRDFSRMGGAPKKTVFVVPDLQEVRAYQREFSTYRFYEGCAMLESLRRDILIMDPDGSLSQEQLGLILNQCVVTNTRVLIYAPQTKLIAVVASCSESGIYIDALLGLPVGISRIAPAKKVLIFGSTECHDTVRVMTAERNAQPGKGKTGASFLPVNALYISRRCVDIPRNWLSEGLTIQQMLIRQENLEHPGGGIYSTARTFAWSREITIFYTIYERENGNLEGRAYVKELSYKRDKFHYGRRIGPLKMKGLRGKSIDEILQKFPQILFESDLYNAYLPILEDLYINVPGGLSLKTIWYMLWGDLQATTTYNDGICRTLFCGECSALAGIYPMTASEDEIMDALVAVCGEQEVPEALLKQLSLIFKIAFDRNFFAENRLPNVITRVRNQRTEEENIVSRLRKRTVTARETKRILNKLLEIDGEFPRYASNNHAFFMAMTLFTPLSLVNMRALTWDDIIFDSDLCRINVTRKITRDGRVIGVESPHYVPCSPIITMICEKRLHYIETVLGVTRDALSNAPVFWENDPSLITDLFKMSPISHAKAKKLQKEMLKLADIQTAATTVTDGDEIRIIDLNDIYMRTFWCENAVTQTVLRGLEHGEAQYILGKTPLDTVDAHYFGFGAAYNQLRMAAIQHRWTAPYEALLQPATDMPWQRTFSVDSNIVVHSVRDHGKCSLIYFEIYSDADKGEIQLSIDSQYGHRAEMILVDDLR